MKGFPMSNGNSVGAPGKSYDTMAKSKVKTTRTSTSITKSDGKKSSTYDMDSSKTKENKDGSKSYTFTNDLGNSINETHSSSPATQKVVKEGEGKDQDKIFDEKGKHIGNYVNGKKVMLVKKPAKLQPLVKKRAIPAKLQPLEKKFPMRVKLQPLPPRKFKHTESMSKIYTKN